MRILYHHRTLGDGAEGVHIASMVSAFQSLGHEVHVSGLASGAGRARQGLAEQLKRTLPDVVFEAASFASNAPDYLDVRRAIRRLAPDFVYKRHARNDVAAPYAAETAGVPLVLEVNCLFAGPRYRAFEPVHLRRLTAACERRALQAASAVVSVSTPLAQEIAAFAGVDALVLPNGADPSQFDPGAADPGPVRARYGLAGALVVGWAGVVRDWHGLELLLDAMAPLRDVRVLVVGDGPARGAIEARASALGLSGRLTITGRVAHDQMPGHIAAMDVAVVAADRTGVASPMKLLEYMSMARPVVAPSLANIRDVIEDGVDGRLFRDGDREDLRKVLHALAADSKERERLGSAARRSIVERLNWRRNAERVIARVGEARARG